MFLAKSTFMIDYPRWDVADGRMIWPLLGQFQGLPKQCAIICGKKTEIRHPGKCVRVALFPTFSAVTTDDGITLKHNQTSSYFSE